MVEHWFVTPLMQVQFPSAARDFSQSQISVQTLLPVSVHPRVQSLALSYICALVKDPVVHVSCRVCPACTVGWIARLLQLAFPGEPTQISHGRNPIRTIQL